MPALAIHTAVRRKAVRHAVHYGMRARVFLRGIRIFGRAAPLDIAVLRPVEIVSAVAKPPVHYIRLGMFGRLGRWLEDFVEARKREMVLLIFAVNRAHLIDGALFVGPVAAL